MRRRLAMATLLAAAFAAMGAGTAQARTLSQGIPTIVPPDQSSGRIPLDRLGDPITDIGPAVRFLLSDDARYVTGQTLMVDGGSCSIS